jgi:NADPH:quinone reductase-like Zn-dependent oxidoreductase
VVGRPFDDVPVPAAKLHLVFVRMAFASAMVVGVTLASTEMGPQVSGMLTAIPVISAMMAVSTHRSAGGESVAGLVSGAVAGLWGGAAFFVVVAALITGAAPAVTYLAAALAAAAAAGTCGWLMAHARTHPSSLPRYSA